MTTRLVAPHEFPKLVVVAAGPSECGKTQALEDLFLCDAPRRVSIDFNGEVRAKHNPDAIEVYSVDGLRDALTAAAGYERWHVALCVDPDAMPEIAPRLARMLNPARTSSDHRSFAREVGGVAIDCSEARNAFPNVKATWAQQMVAMCERGRHNRLSVFAATQAPQSVDRRVTDNANHLLAFRTQEEAVWAYWRATTSTAVADAISELPQYHCAWIVKDEQTVFFLDEHRETLRVVDYKGRTLEGDALEPAATEGEA